MYNCYKLLEFLLDKKSSVLPRCYTFWAEQMQYNYLLLNFLLFKFSGLFQAVALILNAYVVNCFISVARSELLTVNEDVIGSKVRNSKVRFL